jgi:ABC-type Fe3+-hydroxamate transport system substrate-binding protein
MMVLGVSACVRGDDRPSRDTDGALGHAQLFVDDAGDTTRVRVPARRIASLNPATTELLVTMGAQASMVGRTTWDLYPAAAAQIPDLGPGIRPNVEAILGAAPDVALLYATDDNRAAAARLREAGVAVLALRVDRIEDFARAASTLGRLLGDTARAAVVRDSVLASIARAAAAARADTSRSRAEARTVAWRLWDQPLIVLGPGSFLSQLIDSVGGRNAFAELTAPSPQVGFESLVERDPWMLVVGPGAFERVRRDPRYATLRAVKEGRLVAADTAVTGRPGVRMGEAAHWMLRTIARADSSRRRVAPE